LSISLAAWLNAGLLYWKLRQQAVYLPQAGWSLFLARIVTALAVMAAVLIWSMGESAFWLEAAASARVARLAWVVAAGASSYLLVLWLLGFRLSDFSKRVRS
jgi:putative peptidoglycan lipid II flippase